MDHCGHDLNCQSLDWYKTPAFSANHNHLTDIIDAGLDWIEQCFTSPPTQYRLYANDAKHNYDIT